MYRLQQTLINVLSLYWSVQQLTYHKFKIQERDFFLKATENRLHKQMPNG